MRNRKNAFTLVELLSVIVILSIILVIAVPKVMSIITDSKKATFEASARQILQYAENRYIENKVLGINEEIKCNNIAKINKTDYEICKIEFDNSGKAKLTLKGSGKFEGLYICKNKKNTVEAVSECNIDKTSIELTIQKNDGTEDIIETYEEGITIELETLTREGYIFEGWEIVKGDSVISDNKLTTGSEDTIVYAKWKRNTLVTIDYDNGEDGYSNRHVTNTTINLEIPSKENYKFVRWELVSGNSVLSGNSLTIGTEDTLVKAIWELNIFNLSIDLDGGSVSENQEGTYQVGETITLVSPTKEGYTFSHWEFVGESGILSGNIFIMRENDVTLIARWTANTNTAYLVRHWVQNLGADAIEDSDNYTIYDTENKTGTTDTNVTPDVKNITGFTSPVTQTLIIKADGSTVVNYYYTRNSYDFVLSSQVGIETEGSTLSGKYQYGETITLCSTLNSGYTFREWKSSDSNLVENITIQNSTFIMPAGDLSMTANVNELYLYNNGINYMDITGGWSALTYPQYYNRNGATPSITYNTDNFILYLNSGSNYGGRVQTNNEFDLSLYKKITIKYVTSRAGAWSGAHLRILSNDSATSTLRDLAIEKTSITTATMDLSEINSNSYISIVMGTSGENGTGGTVKVTIYEIMLEKN